MKLFAMKMLENDPLPGCHRKLLDTEIVPRPRLPARRSEPPSPGNVIFNNDPAAMTSRSPLYTGMGGGDLEKAAF